MQVTEQFMKAIDPFFWVFDEEDKGASVCLNVGEYLQDIFDTRADEGCEGNGYDWESLASAYVSEVCVDRTDFAEAISFDSEAEMFCAYSENVECLADFIYGFKKVCDDRAHILELFRCAELD